MTGRVESKSLAVAPESHILLLGGVDGRRTQREDEMQPIRSGLAVVAVPLLALLLGLPGCGRRESAPQVVKAFPIADTQGVLAPSMVVFDSEITADGNGSFRIETEEPTVVRLYLLPDPDLENTRLTYVAKVRSRDLEGSAYLEMWCQFSGMGRFYSRSIDEAISGTQDWSVQESPFFLKAGENPDEVELNLVVDGKGTVWIDDIRLLRAPLR